MEHLQASCKNNFEVGIREYLSLLASDDWFVSAVD